MCLAIELSSAVYTGYVRAGILPVQQGLPIICCLKANFCVPFRKVHQNSRENKRGPQGYVFVIDLT